MKQFWFIGALLFGVYFWSGRDIARPGGVLVPEEPVQRQVYTSRLRVKNGYQIALLASFDIRARVIAVERYRFDRGAALSPVDLALGWGPMSNGDILKQISFSQGGRFYSWWAKNYPVPRNVIESHSANMHMIPADDDIESRLKSTRAGNLVHIKGYLVEAMDKDGFRWKSSLSRSDTGAGACELIWVESLEIW
ncbi:MAG: hypothetical protein ACXWW4_14490 [Candidatus Binatia bacterium]